MTFMQARLTTRIESLPFARGVSRELLALLSVAGSLNELTYSAGSLRCSNAPSTKVPYTD
jgi:hypothetical protein